MNLVSRVDVLETRAEAARDSVERAHDAIDKSNDAISALAESHRVAWEKTQQQIWDMRREMATLLTADQFHNSHNEILNAIRSRPQG